MVPDQPHGGVGGLVQCDMGGDAWIPAWRGKGGVLGVVGH